LGSIVDTTGAALETEETSLEMMLSISLIALLISLALFETELELLVWDVLSQPATKTAMASKSDIAIKMVSLEKSFFIKSLTFL
jgi:hypothetical protein